MTTINKFIADLADTATRAAKLGVTLQGMIKSAHDQKKFKTDLYAAAKAKDEYTYMACRQLYSRALKALGMAPTDTRGVNSKKAAPAAKVAPADKAAPAEKTGGMSDALALARVGELATAFLVADDRAIMARLLAAIDNGRKAATTGKRK